MDRHCHRHARDDDGYPLPTAQASEVIAQIEPGVVVPMHFATATTSPSLGLEPLDKFARELGLLDLAPRDRLALKKNDIPEATQFIVLADRNP
jgi:hypothetical protein